MGSTQKYKFTTAYVQIPYQTYTSDISLPATHGLKDILQYMTVTNHVIIYIILTALSLTFDTE